MIWALLFLCQLALTQPGHGVYHELSASWFNVAFNHSDALFGYSVTYVPTSKRLIVSAPQGDNNGQIYSCDLTKENQCTTLEHDPWRRFDSSYNHSYWFGATVKAGPSYFVTCAPLNVHHKKFINKDGKEITSVGTFSRCYKYTDLSKKPIYMRPISEPDRLRHAKLFEHIMDSFGWSIDVDGDDIIIGGPAMLTGRAVKYDSKLNPISLTGFKDDSNSRNFARRVDYNFGYSVVVGYFTTKMEELKKREMKTYAVGSPYGKMGYGQVSFYQFTEKKAFLNQIMGLKSREDLRTHDPFAVGSMFGAVLGAARLTPGSNATTLLVGAPTYAEPQRYNLGAVYFYAPAPKLPLKDCVRKIVGTIDGGFFGSAIARLGDYNGDGLDEIAIAAPYADSGAGAVYIYSSADIIKEVGDITWIQRVSPSGGATTPYGAAGLVMSFGLSLASVQDFDENGCNELAIGAPESDRVMMLRCIASVTLKVDGNIPEDLSLRDGNPFRNKDHFIFESCLEVNYPEKPNIIFAHINVSVEIDHPDAKLDKATDKVYDVYLKRTEPRTCKNITVSAPLNGNYQLPITYRINANQYPEDMVKFDASHVALSDRSNLTYSGIIWLTECKNVTHCQPDLELTKNLPVTLPYVVGSPEKLNLTISVRNHGETAYGAYIHIFAVGVDVESVPRGCERLHARLDALLCRPPGALRKADEPWYIPGIPFDSSHLTSDHESINISIALYNDYKQTEPEWQYVHIPLKADYSMISIKGITDTGITNAVNMSKDDIDGKTFEHSYTISSRSLTNWVTVEVQVVRQNRSFIEYGPIYMSSVNSQNEQCQIEPTTEAANETIFTCIIHELNSKQSAKIIVPMKIISPEELDMAITAKQNSQYTSLTLKLKEETRISNVTSTLHLGGQLSIWIIVVASLVGLLILLLLFCLLSRCGFFKRDKRVELENVRKSVRRQTIMRRTMAEGVRLPPAELDRRSLLRSVSEETAEQAAARDKRVRLNSDGTKNKVR